MKAVAVSFYDAATGIFSGVQFHGPQDQIEINTPNGHAVMDGRHDHLSKRVDLATKTVVDYQPPTPSVDHEWNTVTRRWQLTAAAQAKEAAATAARARIAELNLASIPLLRKALLGSTLPLGELKRIEDEYAALEGNL